MPFDPGLKREASQKLEQYEGRVNHLYLDSEGKVTVGVGHLVVNSAAMASLAMYKVGLNGVQQVASLQDKQSEYENIIKLAKNVELVRNKSSAWYKRYTKLVMKNSDIDSLRDRQLDTFYRELVNIYRKRRGCFESFDQLPRPVKMALLDMIFNVGATRLSNHYPQMNANIRAGNWSRAARESSRLNIDMRRNEYVRQLFLSAAREEAAN